MLTSFLPPWSRWGRQCYKPEWHTQAPCRRAAPGSDPQPWTLSWRGSQAHWYWPDAWCGCPAGCSWWPPETVPGSKQAESTGGWGEEELLQWPGWFTPPYMTMLSTHPTLCTHNASASGYPHWRMLVLVRTGTDLRHGGIEEVEVDADLPSTNIQKKLVRWKYLRRTWRMQLMVERFVKVPFLSWSITMKCWNIKSLVTKNTVHLEKKRTGGNENMKICPSIIKW